MVRAVFRPSVRPCPIRLLNSRNRQCSSPAASPPDFRLFCFAKRAKFLRRPAPYPSSWPRDSRNPHRHRRRPRRATGLPIRLFRKPARRAKISDVAQASACVSVRLDRDSQLETIMQNLEPLNSSISFQKSAPAHSRRTLHSPVQIEWSFKPGRLHSGDLLRHLPEPNVSCGTDKRAASQPSRYPPRQNLAEGHEAVFAYFEFASTPNPWKIFSALTDADLQKKTTTPDGASITLWKWLPPDDRT